LGVIEKSLATAQMQAPRLAYCSMGTTYYVPKPGGRKRAEAAIPCHFVGLARWVRNDRAQGAALMQPVRRVCNGIG
jgi:hypothetical protein